MRRLLSSCLGLAASLSLGCSGDSGAASAGGDGGESASSSASTAASSTTTSAGTGGAIPYPAPHAPLPILQDTGGPRVTAPKVVEVFFTNDDAGTVAEIKDFVPKLGASQYWQSMVAEYGIGAYTATTVDLPMALTGTLDDTDIQSWIVDQIENGGVLPQPDDQTIYALYFPAGTMFTIEGSRSCIDYYGYHSSTKLDADHGGGDVIYAPLARCPATQGYSELELVTALTSHELAEATTDPLYYTDPAYQSVDARSGYWELLLGGGEVADLCGRQGAFALPSAEVGYSLERAWSNAAAAASHDPCSPSDTTAPYFNTAPAFPDHDIEIFGLGNSDGIRMQQGDTRTVELDLFSDGPTAPWRVDVYDESSLRGGPVELEFTLDPTTGVNGDKIMMSIYVVQADPTRVESFSIVSTSPSGEQHMWAGLVSQ